MSLGPLVYLELTTGAGAGRRFDLPKGESMIGRQADCAVVLPKATVSRRHAKLTLFGRDLVIEDLGSQNGTLVNGEIITGPTPLFTADTIRIDEFTLKVQSLAPVDTRPELYLGEEDSLDEELEDAKATFAEDEPPLDDGTILQALDVETSIGVGVAAKAPQKLAALQELTRNIGSSLQIDDVLPRLLESLLRIFPQADGVAVYLLNAREEPELKAATSRGGDVNSTVASQSILRKVLRDGQAVLSGDAANDQRFDDSESLAGMRLHSVMCAPLIGPSRKPLGVIQLDNYNEHGVFTVDELELLASIAMLAGMLVEFARLHATSLDLQRRALDLKVAESVQLHLLPPKPPELPGYEFFEHYHPADRIGGDYYGYIAMPDGRLAVAVGDVAGKGISAALLMARLCSDVRYRLVTSPTPEEAVGALNRELADGRLEGRFVTFCVCILDPKQHEVTLISAGHLPPILRRQSTGQSELLAIEPIRGLPLGLDENYRYRSLTLKLEPGDRLLLYTDGISEAPSRDGGFYGIERLLEQTDRSAETIAEWGRFIVADVKQHLEENPKRDDICLVGFARKTPRHASGSSTMRLLNPFIRKSP